jgi:hypothetical protein
LIDAIQSPRRWIQLRIGSGGYDVEFLILFYAKHARVSRNCCCDHVWEIPDGEASERGPVQVL